MDITLDQAYDAALATIGRLTVEQHFYQAQIAEHAAEIKRLTDTAGKDRPDE